MADGADWRPGGNMTSNDTFLKRLQQGVLIGDGAMGTMLYQRGVFLNSCFDELNLSQPGMVLEIHKAYVNVGVDFIETNTFGANAFKLGRYGLAENLEQINTAAVRIAREAAGQDVLVAGSVGPLGVELTDFGPVTADQAVDAFARQLQSLTAAGVDFLLLETFSSTDELLAAVKAASQCTDLPVVAQMSVNEDNETIYGEPVAAAMGRLAAEPTVTVVGLNCSLGPSEMLSTLELIRSVTHKPISVQPNAGMPRHVEGRTLYMCTPEYMAEYAKRFFEKGARIIGGCCGTTPEHIGQIIKAVRPLHGATVSSVRVLSMATVASAQAAQAVEPVPLPQKSRIGAKLAAGEKITSIEITPPRGLDIGPVIEKARLCAEHGIDAINIPDGPRASSRMSPMITAVRIQQSADIEAILHVCCRDRNLIGMQSDMLGAAVIGLNNVLIITGDPPKMGEYPHATGVFDLDSVA
ncbi:MAG TPA: bifunctional homocysteine S-methyltransferase/methylenetetrahydrofolate reductase, partial [Phycisphaerales bacterium]|nr:bifunctional homocysteine S-methyltransferase/methylenetetrahydrofolate reductase [Phycisphaerales bacterium]